MAKRMLVDATHPEETRVVVLHGNRLEEFDFETATKKQLKGNIYLAKVTRVEPSLQAAFIEYGGNRHGFLAFSEVHPDYYRIPVDDRQALLAQDAVAQRTDDPVEESSNGESADDPFRDPRDDDDSFLSADIPAFDGGTAGSLDLIEDDEPPADDDERAEHPEGDAADGTDDEAAENTESIETVGGDGVDEARERRMARMRRSYKIQEVIKRRQILLVQVTKEERGNKGAALTTYLSLAGRYCVLMPNTPRGGGISRKIANPKDRKRMKAILDELDLPDGMAVILRTAGLERNKTEIRRDLDYLLRLWDSIRETTLESTAPTLIHEEANLIKRAIRDLYSKDVDEIDVAGEEGYRTAKDFMRMLVPSHARKVKPYREGAIPLFQRYQIESQIDAMHSPVVQLKSGGYLVINPTEALVAIDVNSGRSTRERNIEETAYRTNLEAAEEVARQLRLRDLAGLIVIDFIDMEQDRHNNAVERQLKESLRLDRARIQVGPISHFGLLEMSRQRLRPSLTETQFDTCVRCQGVGLVRSIGSSSLHILRAIEEEGIRQRSAEIAVTVPTDVALYLLNEKRDALVEIEQRYGFRVMLRSDDTLIAPDHRLQTTRARGEAEETQRPAIDATMIKFDVEEEDEAAAPERDDGEAKTVAGEAEAIGEEQPRRKRRSRRGRRRRDDGARTDDEGRVDVTAADLPTVEDMEGEMAEGVAEDATAGDGSERAPEAGDESGLALKAGADRAPMDESEQPKKRRRGRRGGRRRSGTQGAEDQIPVDETASDAVMATVGDGEPEITEPWPLEATADSTAVADGEARSAERDDADATGAQTVAATDAPAEPKRKRAPRSRSATAKPRRSRRKKPDVEIAETAEGAESMDVAGTAAPRPDFAGDEAPPPADMPASEPEPMPEPEPGPIPEREPVGLATAPKSDEQNGRSQIAHGTAGRREVVNRPSGSPRRGWWRRVLDG